MSLVRWRAVPLALAARADGVLNVRMPMRERLLLFLAVFASLTANSVFGVAPLWLQAQTAAIAAGLWILWVKG